MIANVAILGLATVSDIIMKKTRVCGKSIN